MVDILRKIKESDKNLFVGLAGPGTGKSTTFKTIINADEFKGKKILILSFINKLVNDLSRDFENFKNVEVLTLHSFALRELRKQTKNKINLDPNLDRVISEDFSLMEKVDIDYEKKFYENDLSKKDEDFYKSRKEFYESEGKLYSFNSIVYVINKIFEEESKTPSYDLILIDEFQDFNKLEYELIKLLNKKSRVILVGDDNQSLYDFKKAAPKQIRDLYNDSNIEKFSMDYCYRCTEVIVNATDNFIKNAKKKDYLKNNLDKIFLYPRHDEKHQAKHELSQKYSKIDFISSVSGDLLIYKLAQNIKEHVGENKKRILILIPSYLKQSIYDGLIEKGFNVVDFELFSNEECNRIKHKDLVETFKVLTKRKTDNFAIRKNLSLYLDKNEIGTLLKENKKIWLCLKDEIKKSVEKDIEIFNLAGTPRL